MALKRHGLAALRWLALGLVVPVAACASPSGADGPGPPTHSPSYQRGYDAGRQARVSYGVRPGSNIQDLAAYCAERAYAEIQPMKGALVLWSEGFDAGCRTSLRQRRQG